MAVAGIYSNAVNASEKRLLETELARVLAAAASMPITIDAEFNGADFGLVGDGRTDNTVMLRSLLAESRRRLVIPKGDYVTGSLTIPDNTVLVLEPGVILRDSGKLVDSERLINILGENVRIIGRGARLIANRSDYTSGEQRHGVFIYGARNVFIDSLESSGHGGDGFYVGGDGKAPPENIVIRNCRSDNNRRQGLSLTSGRDIWVIDCEFLDTRGTLPEFGIDIEPDYPTEVLERVRIIRPRTWANNGGGIQFSLHNLAPSSVPVDIVVMDHVSLDERLPLQLYPYVVPGRVIYDSE